MVLKITVDGRLSDLSELDNLLQTGPIPRTIRVVNGEKYMSFILADGSRQYSVTSGSVGAGLTRQNAMSAEVVSNVIDAIKRRFLLAGGKRRKKTRKTRKTRR